MGKFVRLGLVHRKTAAGFWRSVPAAVARRPLNIIPTARVWCSESTPLQMGRGPRSGRDLRAPERMSQTWTFWTSIAWYRRTGTLRVGLGSFFAGGDEVVAA